MMIRLRPFSERHPFLSGLLYGLACVAAFVVLFPPFMVLANWWFSLWLK